MYVHEVFTSINGEVCYSGQGSLATFVRLSGCNLNCSYCDTKQAQKRNEVKWEVGQVVDKIPINIKNVTITGGEPLVQYSEVCALVSMLKELYHKVTIETNGSILHRPFGTDCIVMDYKLPSSEMSHNMLKPETFAEWANEHLHMDDWVKFVIQDSRDADIAKKIIRMLDGTSPRIAVSAVEKTIRSRELLEWLKENKLWNVTLNVQIHKLIKVA